MPRLAPLHAGALALALIAGPAAAHIVIAERTAVAGATDVVSLQVEHGCAGAATVALRVEIPAGVASAKAQFKPGWSITSTREGPRTVAITWTGRLPDDQFDRFPLLVKLPRTAGPLYFPTVQTCETGEERWVEIPAPGAAWTSVRRPAPVLTLTDPARSAGEEATSPQR